MKARALSSTSAVVVSALLLAFAAGACGSDVQAPSQPAPPPAEAGAGEPTDGGSDGAEPHSARSGLPSSGLTCASIASAELGCTACPDGEICFTQVACGPVPDGGAMCGRGEGEADDRCHRTCSSDEDCASSEECVRRNFFHCNDFAGGPDGIGICCAVGSGCR